MRQVKKLRAAAAFALIFAALAIIPTSTPAASTSHLTNLTVSGYGDTFYNYDFTGPSITSSNVDWSVSLLFYNAASVTKVKNLLSDWNLVVGSSPYVFAGSTMHAYLNNWYLTGYLYRDPTHPLPNGTWNSDSGEKTDLPICGGSSRHYRIYAPNSNFMYNPYMGYYVVATTHRDHDEICNPWYDDSEGTEMDIASIFSNGYFPAIGVQVYRNYANFLNPADPNPTGTNHIWNNNGRATYIRIPGTV